MLQRIEKKIDKTGKCWIWTGAKNAKGYGFVWLDKLQRAHRVVYESLVGPIPEGLTLDHLCGNPSCVNPDHLEPVTNAVNVRRGGNAAKTHCPRGHEYDLFNTGRGSHGRYCRTCKNKSRRIIPTS